jgi:hypothetical protein
MTEESLKDIAKTLRSIEAQLLATNLIAMLENKGFTALLNNAELEKTGDTRKAIFELVLGRYTTLNPIKDL